MGNKFLKSSLWIDSPNFDDELGARESSISSDILAHCAELSRNGFTIIERCVSEEIVEKFLADITNIRSNPTAYYASFGTTVRSLNDFDINEPLTKLLDLYVNSNWAREVLLSSKARNFLEAIFEDQICLFQSLYFQKGSTQAIHQDPAYVVVENLPHNIVATWVALEDVLPGSGELVYIEGSHKDITFEYPEHRVNWIEERDGHGIHDHHLHTLEEFAQLHPERVKRFLPRKGDVLFWHSNLAHGGSPITNQNVTRKSLVGHFCPAKNVPRYANSVPNRFFKWSHGVVYRSLYYDDKVVSF